MKEEFLIFRAYSDSEEAMYLKKILNENGIDTIIADDSPPVDITFTGGGFVSSKIEIRIKQSEFERAEKILEKLTDLNLEEIDSNYYLFSFSDDELYDVLLKSDEWNKFDYNLAQKILKKRGKNIDNDLLISLKRKRLEDLAKPDENQGTWIFAGYIFSILGGFLGLIIGYFLWTSKKTLPNGKKVYSYSQKDRKQGKYIFYVGLLFFPLWLFLKFFSFFKW